MTTTQIGFSGLTPSVTVKSTNPERDKYRAMWQRQEYRTVAPGEHSAMTFLAQARLPRDAEVIDFGCGTGRGGVMIAALGGARVRLVDFAENCLDDFVREALVTQKERVQFSIADLTRPIPWSAPYGYCTDVMEHIPTVDVQKVLKNILGSAQHVFFQISCVEDKLGALIGEPLHLTVRPPAWWIEQLTNLGAIVHWTASNDEAVAVYCSAWTKDAAQILPEGKIHDRDNLDENARKNIEAGWQHAVPFDTQKREIVLLAGGPSMRSRLKEIVQLRADGAALVTVNGAYEWAIENGLDPSMQIVLDARQFNARFTRRPHPTCRYMIASQAHPDTLEGLPRERTYLWHAGVSDEIERLIRERTGHYFPIPGGSTVVLRAIPLLRMLGFRSIHLFGFDSCVLDGVHHAYSQPENDAEMAVPVTCGGSVFHCTPWMLSQASEFRDLVKFMGDEVELAVYGEGLIAHMINHGAELATKE